MKQKFQIIWGGGRNLERRNVERTLFWNFEIANIKIKKDELFDSFNFFICNIYIQYKYIIIYQILKY